MGFGMQLWAIERLASEIWHPEWQMGGRQPSPTPHQCCLFRKPSTPGVVLSLDMTFQLVSVEIHVPEIPGGVAFSLVVEVG